MRYSFLVTAAVLAGSPALCSAATASPPVSARAPARASLKMQADAILDAAYGPDGPGAAAIITRDGKLIYAAGRGLADVEAHRPIAPDTVFQLGSIAKQFTAAVILQLVREGRISLDDPLSRFFPDWPQPGANATVRQLLNHSSGIQDYSKTPGWIAKNGTRSFTTEELLQLTKSLGSKAPPGTKWEYNNGGYVILGGIVEKVTGKPWYEAVEQRIARPLGLTSLRYAVDAERSQSLAHRYGVDDGKVQPSPPIDMSIAGAAGGLVASVRDMAKWADALHHGKVVSRALYREMTSPAHLSDGSTAPYGFALRLRRLLGHAGLEHGGAGRGIDTASIYFPDSDLFVAVFSNSDDAPADAGVVLRRLSALAMGSPFPNFVKADVDPKAVEPLFGRYGGKDGPEMRFFSSEGHYFLASGDDELPLLAAGGDRFFSAADGLDWVRFVRAADGTPRLELHDPSEAQAEHYVRLGPIPANAEVKVPASVLQSYVGDYTTEVAPVTVAIGPNGALTMQPKSGPVLEMRPVSRTEFRVAGDKMRVVFHPENGRVDSFTLYRGAREMHGRRVAK